MNKTKPQTLEELLQEFRKKFVRSDGEVDEYAEDLEAFIKKVYEAGREVEREKIEKLLPPDKEVNYHASYYEGKIDLANAIRKNYQNQNEKTTG